MTRSPNSFSWFHLQYVIHAIEVVEQANRRDQFDDLAFIEMFTQIGPMLVIERLGIASHDLGQAQRALLALVEVGAGFEFRELIDLLIAPAQPPCQDGMRCQSILAIVDL